MLHHELLSQKILLFYLYSQDKPPRIKPNIIQDRRGAYAQKKLGILKNMLQSV